MYYLFDSIVNIVFNVKVIVIRKILAHLNTI